MQANKQRIQRPKSCSKNWIINLPFPLRKEEEEISSKSGNQIFFFRKSFLIIKQRSTLCNLLCLVSYIMSSSFIHHCSIQQSFFLSFFFFCRILFQSMEVSTFVYPFIFFVKILTTPHSIWDLSSSTRDQTCAPCIGGQGLNHWTAREVSMHSSFDGHLGFFPLFDYCTQCWQSHQILEFYNERLFFYITGWLIDYFTVKI